MIANEQQEEEEKEETSSTVRSKNQIALKTKEWY